MQHGSRDLPTALRSRLRQPSAVMLCAFSTIAPGTPVRASALRPGRCPRIDRAQSSRSTSRRPT
eukprot:5873526-Pyramimonas_sp.AAC.1